MLTSDIVCSLLRPSWTQNEPRDLRKVDGNALPRRLLGRSVRRFHFRPFTNPEVRLRCAGVRFQHRKRRPCFFPVLRGWRGNQGKGGLPKAPDTALPREKSRRRRRTKTSKRNCRNSSERRTKLRRTRRKRHPPGRVADVRAPLT